MGLMMGFRGQDLQAIRLNDNDLGHVFWERSLGTTNHISGLWLLQWNMQHSLLNFDLLSRLLTHNHFSILLIQDPQSV